MDQFHDQLSAALRRWDCSVDGRTLRGGMSAVVPVRSSAGAALMLKILDREAATREAIALRAFPLSASVRCFDHAADLGALLLERLTSRSLTEVPVDEQITVQARLARRLAVDTPPGIERLSDTRGLMVHLNMLLVECPDLFSDRVIGATRESITALGDDPTSTLTHGDLHTINVHQDQDGRWRVIDPSPRVGTIAYESHTVIVERPRLDELRQAGAPELRRRLALFAEVADVDRGLAERLCQSRAVLSALHGWPRGQTRLADNLRWMAEELTPSYRTRPGSPPSESPYDDI